QIATELLKRLLWTRLKRLRQQADVVVEQLKIVSDLLHASNRRHVLDHHATSLLRNRIRRLPVKIRLDHDDFYMFTLHHVAQLKGMARSGRNPRPRLHKSDYVQSKM